MAQLLDILNKYIWIGDFAVLCVFVILALKLQQNNSNVMTMGVIVLISGIIMNYQPLVKSIVSPDTSQTIFILWCFGFAAFQCLLAFMLFKGYQWFKRRSNLTANVFAVVATLFMTAVVTVQFGPLLFSIDGSSYKLWRLFAFDFGTTGLLALAMYAIWQIHQLNQKTYGFIARMYLLAFFVIANIHMATFTELYLSETDYLAGVYHWGLMGIHIGTSLVTMLIAGLAIFQNFSKKKREGGIWGL